MFLSKQVPTQEPADTAPIVQAGKLFLKTYVRLASRALKLARPLFIFRPKIHYLEHIIIDLEDAMKKNVPAFNPLSYSCSTAEDFIGRACLLSRRVAAVTNERRVLQRWLAGAMSKWKAASS